jgi:hypothetical protein
MGWEDAPLFAPEEPLSTNPWEAAPLVEKQKPVVETQTFKSDITYQDEQLNALNQRIVSNIDNRLKFKMPEPEAEPEYELRAAPEIEPTTFDNFQNTVKNIFQKVGLSKTTTAKNVESQLQYEISKQTGLPLRYVAENYDELITDPKITGISSDPTTLESVEFAFQGAVTVGLATAPISTALGVGAFMALDEVENAIISKVQDDPYVFGGGKNVSDLLPEDASRATKEVVEILDLLAKGAIIGAGRKKIVKDAGLEGKIIPETWKDANWKAKFVKNPEKFVWEKVAKEYITEYNMPPTIYIDPAKAKAILVTGDKTKFSPIEAELLTELGIDKGVYKQALKEGISIEVPTEQVIKLADKPWWAKAKGIFGIEKKVEVVSQKKTPIKSETIKKALPAYEETIDVKTGESKVAYPIKEPVRPVPIKVKPEKPVEPVKPTEIVKEPKIEPVEVPKEPVTPVEVTPVSPEITPEAPVEMLKNIVKKRPEGNPSIIDAMGSSDAIFLGKTKMIDGKDADAYLWDAKDMYMRWRFMIVGKNWQKELAWASGIEHAKNPLPTIDFVEKHIEMERYQESLTIKKLQSEITPEVEPTDWGVEKKKLKPATDTQGVMARKNKEDQRTGDIASGFTGESPESRLKQLEETVAGRKPAFLMYDNYSNVELFREIALANGLIEIKATKQDAPPFMIDPDVYEDMVKEGGVPATQVSIFVKPENKAQGERLAELHGKKYPNQQMSSSDTIPFSETDMTAEEFHREVGSLLGYSKKEIERYVTKPVKPEAPVVKPTTAGVKKEQIESLNKQYTDLLNAQAAAQSNLMLEGLAGMIYLRN